MHVQNRWWKGRTKTWFRGAALPAVLLMMAGCAECAPETVAMGVSRLTVRNVGAVLSIVNANTTCGFASEAVLKNPTIEGSVGSEGKITWTVADCAIDLGGATEISKSCTGGTTTASGRITVSATRTIAGILTGLADRPIVPGGPDAVTIAITKASFDQFKVETSTSPNVLTMKSGSFSAIAKPRLAVSASSGACAVSTPNVAFSEIKYEASSLFVKTPDNEFDVDVKTSTLAAQNGTNGTLTNAVSGSIQVWEDQVSIPTADDAQGLDPDFKADAFEKSFDCTADLAKPVSFTCADLTPRLADGAARLTVRAFGTVTSMLDANTSCGFSSPAVLQAAQANGTVGGTGSVTFTVDDCEIELPAGTELSADCGGVKTIAGGKVTVSGTKTLSGRFTGKAATPIVPNSDVPAGFALEMTFAGFRVGSSADTNALLIKSGTLSGQLSPRTALSNENGACAVSTPVARFSELEYTDAQLALTSSSGTFDLAVAEASLTATNGTWNDTSNALAGTLKIGGKDYTVPSDAKGLNPAFDQASFDASWQCNPKLVSPVTHQCVFVAPLAQGVARLTAKMLGTVASLADANSTCGFSSTAVAGTPTFTGDVGKDGNVATFKITNACTIELPADTVVSKDCAGTETKVGGRFSVTGTKTVKGYRTGNPLKPVVPTSRDPAQFDLVVTFDGFSVGSTNSTASITAKSGQLAGKVAPRTGLDKATGACSISTPVVTFSDLAWTGAALRLVSDGSTFDVTASTSDLDAQNGTKGAVSNTLTGSITLDGAALTVPVNPADPGLDPAFDQATFDAAYQCNPALVVPADDVACSFRQALGVAAARLLVKNAAVATKALDGSTSCGFSAVAVLGAGQVTGAPGEQGSIAWSVDACAIGPLPANTQIAQDCAGTKTHAGGKLTGTSKKTLSGLRTADAAKPVVPVSRSAVKFEHGAIAFDDFSLADVAAGQTGAKTTSTLTGNVATTLTPVLAESSANAGVYPYSTPIGRITGLAMPAGTMTIVSEGSRFDLAISNVTLDAFFGSHGTSTNELSGTITVDDQVVALPAAAKIPLDPEFSQAKLDASYSCSSADLKLVPPATN